MLKKIIFLFWIPWKKAKEKRRENATKKKKKNPPHFPRENVAKNALLNNLIFFP